MTLTLEGVFLTIAMPAMIMMKNGWMIMQRANRDRDDDQLGFDGGEWHW